MMSDSGGPRVSISQKWGFGMAPVKPEHQALRFAACSLLFDVLETLSMPMAGDKRFLDASSEVKGLFNRVLRQDQWDWFTVGRQFGYPSWRICDAIVGAITQLRKSVKDGEPEAFKIAAHQLRRLPTRQCLAVFLGRLRITDEAGAGWIYILSTREMAHILKIGMTTRTVEKRAQEISGNTGVLIPYGVRRCWRVSDPAKAERLIHSDLDFCRVRSDREFFDVTFGEAARRIDKILLEIGIEIRTLNALAALGAAS